MLKLYVKFSFLFILILGCSSPSLAQEKYDWGFNSFIGWIVSIESNIYSISKREKKKKLSRNLGYLASDLDDLWLAKEQIHNLIIEEISKDSTLSKYNLRGIDGRKNIQFDKEFINFNNALEKINERIISIKDILNLNAIESSIALETIDYLKTYHFYKGNRLNQILVYLNNNYNENYSKLSVKKLKEDSKRAVELTKRARDIVIGIKEKIDKK